MRRLAQQAYETSLSVSRLAREHRTSANMLFKWRRHYRAGLLDTLRRPPLRVMIGDAQASAAAGIEFVVADVLVRIEWAADTVTVRAVLQGVRA